MFPKSTFGSNTSGFGGFGQQPAAAGTAHVKYNPVVGTDVVFKSGALQNITIKHHCITCMQEYEGKSLEELRLEDYTAGRKGSTAGVFGGFNQPWAWPLFGDSSSFNSGAATTSPFDDAFKTTTSSAFGAPPAFGAGAATQPTTGLFGSSTPGGGVFGAAPSTGFGGGGGFGAAPTTGFGGGGGFGAAPTTGFGGGGGFGAAPTTGFGGGGGFGFGAGTSGGGLFGASAQPAPLFGAPAQQPFQAKPTGGFGEQQMATETANIRYNPVVGTDVVFKAGALQNIYIKHHCITCMQEYEGKSLEELRLEDYTAGRKG